MMTFEPLLDQAQVLGQSKSMDSARLNRSFLHFLVTKRVDLTHFQPAAYFVRLLDGFAPDSEAPAFDWPSHPLESERC